MPRRPKQFSIGDLVEYTGITSRTPKAGEEPCVGVVIKLETMGREAIVAWPIPDEDGELTSRVGTYEMVNTRKEMSFIHHPRKN